jgi:hypothetical protein
LASAVNVPAVISRPLSPRPAIAPRKSRTAPGERARLVAVRRQAGTVTADADELRAALTGPPAEDRKRSRPVG